MIRHLLGPQLLAGALPLTGRKGRRSRENANKINVVFGDGEYKFGGVYANPQWLG
jgi:hypothetical protein